MQLTAIVVLGYHGYENKRRFFTVKATKRVFLTEEKAFYTYPLINNKKNSKV